MRIKPWCLAGVIFLTACQSSTWLGERHFPTSAAALTQQHKQTPTLDIQRWQTAGGSQVLFVANKAIPMVDIQLTFAAGASRDGAAAGLARLTSNLLGEDAASGLNSDDITRGFESKGADFDTGSYRDMAIIHLRSLSDKAYLTPSVDLLTQVLTPAFLPDNLQRVRTQMLQGLKMEQQVPGPTASAAYMQALFGDHAYGHKPGGTPESLAAIDRQQIAAFYQRYYAAGNVTIALVGDLSRQQAEALAEKISQALPQGKAAPVLPSPAVAAAKTVAIDFPSSQTHLLIGSQAVKRGSPDWPALYVGNWILGGGVFSARLTKAVREDKGLAYSIASDMTPMAASGLFTISLETANESAQQALAITLEQTRQFVHQGPTEEEVQKAIDNITGSFPLSIASNGNIVGQLGAIGFYQLPSDYLTDFIDRVREVTPADVKRAFQRYIHPDQFVVVTVGKAANDHAQE